MSSILIVDDDEVVRDVLYELLCGKHLCHAAASAEKALEWLAEESYDLILLDISLPGISGLEMLARVHQWQPETRVIVISGIDYGQHSGDLMAKMGAFDYLVKPFELQDAAGKVTRALSGARGWLGEVSESVDRALGGGGEG